MNSVAELHTFLRDFDAQHSNCPVARRTAEIRETKERERQAARAVQRQREEQRQQTAANNSITWEAIEERIYDRSRELSRELVALVGDCIGKTRNEDNDHVRRVYDKLREEFRVGMERVPIAKAWTMIRYVIAAASSLTAAKRSRRCKTPQDFPRQILCTGYGSPAEAKMPSRRVSAVCTMRRRPTRASTSASTTAARTLRTAI